MINIEIWTKLLVTARVSLGVQHQLYEVFFIKMNVLKIVDCCAKSPDFVPITIFN